MKTTIRTATMQDAVAVAFKMREADRAEVWASNRNDPMTACTNAVAVSTMAWAAYHDDRPVCIFGVAPLSALSGIGSPWLLGTDEVAEHSLRFLRRCRPYVRRMLGVYPVLVNHVDDRNEASKGWLRWLGFELGEPAPYGPFGVPFRPFRLEVPHV